MAEECIHGLDAGMCDVCYPKRAPEANKPAGPVRPAGRAPSSNTRPNTRARAATRPAGRSSSPAAPVQRLPSLAEQRVYHVTHVRNLPGILEAGAVWADLSDSWHSRPVVDISAADTRTERRSVRVGGEESPLVASHVPFFLTPDASVWSDLRSRVLDPRLSPEARQLQPTSFVILVSSLRALSGSDARVMVADGDAADVHTRFGTLGETGDGMLHRLNAAEDRLAAGELLVHDSVPFEQITLIGVAHHNAREEVRQMLQSSGHRPRVAVHPPWFQPPA